MILWHGTAQGGAPWHGTVRHGMACHAMLLCTTAWGGAPWHGTVWHGMAWHGMAWCTTAWHSMVQGTMARHGGEWHDITWRGRTQHGASMTVQHRVMSRCVTAWQWVALSGTACHGTAQQGAVWHTAAWHGCPVPVPSLSPCPQGIFVQLVKANSPAALVGLRFGDQILQINGKNCTGWSSDKAQRALKKASPEKIIMVVRDRPFQRTVTVHKDSTGHVGIVVKKGKIVSLAKDSSAARNGLLTHHYICEVNGQNVIGMKDKQLMEVLAGAGNVVTLTIIPTVIYEHMVKRLSPGLVKSSMDHSIPDL
ncbi:syntenin-2 isoform X1 [Rissa tridactyla]|uniref:syntenin-2 isoform X1 n=1 Tax=Rissa tridactyla TaxID=75485 RepID=UPI0023BB1579|nr:syntenin-2 isoform X1 [Rissa tridactyla]